MAQPIYCDVEVCDKQADMLITDISTGGVQGLCREHFGEMVIEMGTQMIQAEMDNDPEFAAKMDEQLQPPKQTKRGGRKPKEQPGVAETDVAAD